MSDDPGRYPDRMTEAVIVATARIPIGRAVKGSLVDLRSRYIVGARLRIALLELGLRDLPLVLDDFNPVPHPFQ